MVRIYLVSDDGGNPIYVETNKDRIIGFLGKSLELGDDIHLQLWEDGEMIKENWVTGNLILRLERTDTF